MLLIGWKFIPLRSINSEDNPLIRIDDYLVEMTIDEKSSLIDKRAFEFRQMLDVDTSLMGYIDENNKKRIKKPINNYKHTYKTHNIKESFNT